MVSRLLAAALAVSPLVVPRASASAQDAIAAPSPFQAEKARILLRRQLPCLGCHELDGEGGRIGPSLSDVGRRRSGAYIRAIVADPQDVAPGSAMPRTEMPAATRELIVRYLSIGARADTSGWPMDARAETVARPRAGAEAPTGPAGGAALYARWCASCHGPRGDGNGGNAAYLPVRPAAHSSAQAMSGRSDDALFDVIAAGGAASGRSPRMPAFGATLAPAEIRALVGYIRDLCRCVGPEWSRDGSNR